MLPCHHQILKTLIFVLIKLGIFQNSVLMESHTMSPFESGFFYSANAFEVISFNLHIHYHSQRRKIKFRKLNNFLKIIVSEAEFWFHFCLKLCVSCLLAYSLLNSHYEFWNVSSHPAVIFLPCHKQRPGKLRSQMTSGPKEEF